MNDKTIQADTPASQPTPSKEQPSILFACASNILDITSGAALSMRTLLASLAARGFRSVALQGMVFDSPQGGEHVIKAGEDHKDKQVLRTKVLGVEHLIIRTGVTQRPDMTCKEQEIFITRFREEIKARRPDMLILWGGMLLEMTMMREAREAGIPVIFYLVNGGYKNKETFKYTSVIVTDTEATAKLYKERLGLTCHPVGKFIDTNLIKAPQRKPDFITFINPSFEKGVNVFMPLAKLAQTELPQARFLVVQSRGRWTSALKVLKYRPEDFPNVRVIGHQKDMRGVYGATRALLLPSVWHESGARVIPEALLNGIPIIASDSGGSAELIGSAGRVFALPEEVREKRDQRAPDEVVRPWLEEIRKVVTDEAHYQKLTAAADKEAARHDLQRSTDRFIAAVRGAVMESKGIAIPATASASANGAAHAAGAATELAQALHKKKSAQAAKRRHVKKKA
jgi:glycosyltransferase involved in cell wall biosynthesis